MIGKTGTGLLIALLLFFVVIFNIYIPVNDSEKLSSEINHSENSKISNVSFDYISDASNVDFDYYTYFFGLYSQGTSVIARYGKLPVLETQDQKESWNSTLKKLSNNIEDRVASKYMYPHGEIMSCGINARGYFVILFRYGNVDEPLMNEVYSLIDNSAKKMGIESIPVEFGYGTYRESILLDNVDHWFGESTENLSEEDIYNLEEVMRHETTMPVRKTVAAYGKIPLLKNKNEIIAWTNKLSAIADATNEKIVPYGERNEIIVYGKAVRLEIEINKTLPFEKKNTIAKEIYQIIDEEARKQNVTDVPVYFYEGIFTDESSNEESNNGNKQGKN